MMTMHALLSYCSPYNNYYTCTGPTETETLIKVNIFTFRSLRILFGKCDVEGVGNGVINSVTSKGCGLVAFKSMIVLQVPLEGVC